MGFLTASDAILSTIAALKQGRAESFGAPEYCAMNAAAALTTSSGVFCVFFEGNKPASSMVRSAAFGSAR